VIKGSDTLGAKLVPQLTEQFKAQQYPYSRATFFYTNGEPAGLVKDFVDFTLSDAGQKIVANVGFVPVK
jgi:phosphate transport system substrate-binding protein